MSDNLAYSPDPEGLVLRYMESPKPDLRDLIMVQYAGLVERIARKFSGIEAYEDLVQVGFIGLMNALSKFDPEAGVRFNTYATYLVAGEIKHYLRDRSQTIRQPAWLQELRAKVNKAQGSLQAQHGRVPTNSEIAEVVGVSENAVQEVFTTAEMLKVGSLDATVQGDDDTTEVERLDASDFCPEQLGLEDRIVLEHAMQQLRDLERQVLVLFHFEAMNQTEIANQLGISCNYVSHILRQSLAKLRKILSTEEEKDRVLRRQADSLSFDIIDADTAAYTEGYFRNRLEEELHRAGSAGESVALIIIDFKGLDNLRRFYGEQSVRDFMSDASEFLRSSVRRLDIVAKYGKSGYAIVLPFTGATVSVVKRRLMDQATSWANGRSAPQGCVNMMIGQAVSPDDGRGTNELIAAALKDLETSATVEQAA